MKNIIYLILLVVTSKMYSQKSSDITTDELYLKYEKAYASKDFSSIQAMGNLDEVSSQFYIKFSNPKALEDFSKSKDKEKWLKNNSKKTLFNNSQEAIEAYNNYISLKEFYSKETEDLSDLLNQLKMKYDGSLIWETLKSRLQK